MHNNFELAVSFKKATSLFFLYLTFSATPTEGLCPLVYQDSQQGWGALRLFPGSSPGEPSSAAWGRLWTNCPDGVVWSCDCHVTLTCGWVTLCCFCHWLCFNVFVPISLFSTTHTKSGTYGIIRYYPFVISCKPCRPPVCMCLTKWLVSRNVYHAMVYRVWQRPHVCSLEVGKTGKLG